MSEKREMGLDELRAENQQLQREVVSHLEDARDAQLRAARAEIDERKTENSKSPRRVQREEEDREALVAWRKWARQFGYIRGMTDAELMSTIGVKLGGQSTEGDALALSRWQAEAAASKARNAELERRFRLLKKVLRGGVT